MKFHGDDKQLFPQNRLDASQSPIESQPSDEGCDQGSDTGRYFAMRDHGVRDCQFGCDSRFDGSANVATNLYEVVRSLRIAADQGVPTAQLNYGYFLSRGFGVSVDLTEAARYYKLDADQGI